MTRALPIEPLDVLFEEDGRRHELPSLLEELYGGAFGLDEPLVYTNFVSTIDGVVAVPGVPRSNAVIAGGSDGARFDMGLLRAFADCVLIGAGTLAASPKGTWLAERVFPAAESEFAELRRARRRPATPEVAVVTGHGGIDVAHPVLRARAIVLTSDAGAHRLEGQLPPGSELVSLGPSPQLAPARVLEALRERGHALILSEAGPHTFGRLLEAGVVDELFLTVSPLLSGSRGTETTFGLVESVQLLPPGVPARLLSVRRQDRHLFVRYALDRTRKEEPR